MEQFGQCYNQPFVMSQRVVISFLHFFFHIDVDCPKKYQFYYYGPCGNVCFLTYMEENIIEDN